MPYVIGEPCIDVMDRACVEECPVDCTMRAAVRSTSSRTSASTAGRASRCARWRRSTTRTTAGASGALPQDNAPFFEQVLPAGPSRWARPAARRAAGVDTERSPHPAPDEVRR